MSVKLAVKCAIVFAVGTLLMLPNAFAQTSGIVKVSNAIEGGAGGVSAAQCGRNIVVGFGDVESGQPNSWDGFAYSRDGGRTFTDGGTLPIPPQNPDANSASTLGPIGPFVSGSGNPAVACSDSSRFY